LRRKLRPGLSSLVTSAATRLQPPGVRWIEPLFGSLTGVPVHPDATGEEQDALRVWFVASNSSGWSKANTKA
jgi:hypothetical protein